MRPGLGSKVEIGKRDKTRHVHVAIFCGRTCGYCLFATALAILSPPNTVYLQHAAVYARTASIAAHKQPAHPKLLHKAPRARNAAKQRQSLRSDTRQRWPQ